MKCYELRSLPLEHRFPSVEGTAVDDPPLTAGAAAKRVAPHRVSRRRPNEPCLKLDCGLPTSTIGCGSRDGPCHRARSLRSVLLNHELGVTDRLDQLSFLVRGLWSRESNFHIAKENHLLPQEVVAGEVHTVLQGSRLL
jgi:hypothetical protein